MTTMLLGSHSMMITIDIDVIVDKKLLEEVKTYFKRQHFESLTYNHGGFFDNDGLSTFTTLHLEVFRHIDQNEIAKRTVGKIIDEVYNGIKKRFGNNTIDLKIGVNIR